MKQFKFFLQFSRGQRKGIIVLFGMLLLLQLGYFFINSKDFDTETQKSEEEKEWLAVQEKIDALKFKQDKKLNVLHPFNPNFISDYKGYTLGMTPEEIDRIQEFRKTGKFINSAEEFQKITQVPDSILARIAPSFKFPDWANSKNNSKSTKQNIILDVNTATAADFEKVYGIGKVFAGRIIKARDYLGGFITMEQMDYFKEFSPEVLAELKNKFSVISQPKINKIDVNSASLKQLTSFIYFDYNLAKSIITHRSMNGKINRIEDLVEINGFPVDKVPIIALYLDF